MRSSDLIDWIKIASIPAAGTSLTEKNYSFTDRTFPSALNYYRLDQFDIDGVSQQLQTISIDNTTSDNKVIRRVNQMGQEVDQYYRGFVIEYREFGAPVVITR